MINFIFTILFLFSIGSLFGWIIELFYRRFFTSKKWLNPGFLIGPYVPLYGFGLITLYSLSSIDYSFIPNQFLKTFVAIAIMGIAMTLIELIAGLIFIKGMKVKLWDYSDRWANFQGIICPLFSLFWTILGAAYYLLIHPFFAGAVGWLFEHLAFLFVIGMFYGAFWVDIVWSFRLLNKIRAFAKEHNIIVRLEEFKKNIAERAEKNRFLQFFVSLQERNRNLSESMRDYFESIREKTTDKWQTLRKKGKHHLKSNEMSESGADTTTDNPSSGEKGE